MCAAVTSTALSVGMGAFQAISGAKQKKEAQKALNNYERQELDNAFEDIQISTMGSDLMREENQRNTATALDVMSQAGDRAIVGGVPKLVANTNDANREAQKYLDDQVNKRAYAIAGDNSRIEGIIENRDNMNINALGQQVQAGHQDMWSGIMGVGSGLAYGARNIDFSKDGSGSWNDKQMQKKYNMMYGQRLGSFTDMGSDLPVNLTGQYQAPKIESQFKNWGGTSVLTDPNEDFMSNFSLPFLKKG